MIKILDFYAEWCGPCKVMSPILDQIEDELDDVIIEKYDVEENEEIVEDYGIRSIPTLVFIKDDEIVSKHVGSLNKEKLLAIINKIID
jgi:thioredoxin 1